MQRLSSLRWTCLRGVQVALSANQSVNSCQAGAFVFEQRLSTIATLSCDKTASLAQAKLLPESLVATKIHGPCTASNIITIRGLHSTPASCMSDDDNRSAAVRRLAAARARRERGSEPASRARPTSPAVTPLNEPDKLQQLQQPTGELPTTTATTAITPVEGRATEAQLAAALEHSALIVTRPIEWGTILFGYEQANKYTVYDEQGQLVALVAEDYGGLGTALGRQLLRTRRSFTATVFSADGSQVLFRLRRPAYLISSTMYVEDGAGERVGEIHQRWHLLKRNYDLYLGKSQFAAIAGTFLAWEFKLKDAAGGTLALLDRNFQGFAKEIFTDAGKYVIHFGYTGERLQQMAEAAAQQPPAAQAGPGAQQAGGGQLENPPPSPSSPSPLPGQQHATGQIHQGPQQAGLVPGLQSPAEAAATAATASAAVGGAGGGAPSATSPPAGAPPPPVTPLAMMRTDVGVIPMAGGNQLAVCRPLQLSERMVALACALTVDYDYFSQHSHGGGMLTPAFIPMGVPGAGVEGGVPPPPQQTPDLPGAEAAAEVGGEVPLGGEGSWGDGSMGGGAGGRLEEGFTPGSTWGQTGSEGGDGELKWDLGGGDVDGEEGGKGVVGGILGALWGLFGGD